MFNVFSGEFHGVLVERFLLNVYSLELLNLGCLYFSIKAKNLKFTLENFALTGYVGTSGDIDVYCYNFTNNSGICEALGNATFNVTNKFTNTSGKRTEQHTIEFSYYT
ncbi:MAG: hypothetical protein II670_04640 [Alphaproteobacteria bacterium]|nr:hypothetical protein [Alphaproteobacteria bacterium]